MQDPWFTFRQRPRNWKGWLLLVVGVISLVIVVELIDDLKVGSLGLAVATGTLAALFVGVMLATSERPKP